VSGPHGARCLSACCNIDATGPHNSTLALNGKLEVTPEHWPEKLRRAFWTAVNAPAGAESVAATLAFVHELAEFQRAWAYAPHWVTALEQSAVNRVTALIDPENAK
jgi:hypothetical protein